MSSLQRVTLRVPISYVENVRANFGAEGQKRLLADVARRLQALGAKPTQTPIQDPTDNQIVTALVERAPRQPLRFSDDVVQIIDLETIEPYPSLPRLPTAVGAGETALDPGMTAQEIDTVRHVLLTETDPRHIRGFAGTLVPWFPVSASLLYAKANQIDPHSPIPPGGVDLPALGSLEQRTARVAALARQRDLPTGLLRLEVKRTACLLAEDPAADLRQVPKPIVDLARALVKTTSEGARYVDGALASHVCPPDGQEGYVSPAALQLVHAYMKPQASGVVSREEIQRRRQELMTNVRAEGALPGGSRQDRYDLMHAKAAMEKAERTLERLRWIRWYHADAAR